MPQVPPPIQQQQQQQQHLNQFQHNQQLQYHMLTPVPPPPQQHHNHINHLHQQQQQHPHLQPTLLPHPMVQQHQAAAAFGLSEHLAIGSLRISFAPVFTCNLCERPFTDRASFERHSAAAHLRGDASAPDRRLVDSNVGGSGLSVPVQLTAPIDSGADCGSIGNATKSVDGAGRRKPHQCELCLKQFRQKAHLSHHLMTHSGAKPFKCPACDCSFPQQYSLSRHMLRHSDGRPFACDLCGRAFRQKVHLGAHVRTHTGHKPFCCRFCDKQFAHRYSLDRHVSQLHPLT